MAIENKKIVFSKRAPFYHYNNNVRPNSAHHVERYFLISLHCFNIRKTSMNAAAPSRCCVSTTVQLVMYHHWVGDVPGQSLQLNSTQLNAS